MPQFLAIEWDSLEVRAALASTRGGRVIIDQAFAAPLAGGGTPDAERIGAALREALATHGVGRMPCLVAVGRSSVELKNLTLPTAPEEELPDLVKLQALREFNNLAEDWPVDFVTIPGGPDEPNDVLVGAISPELLKEIESACHAAGLEPKRLALRPCAAASLVARRSPLADASTPRLLVDVLAEEVDLTVLMGDTVLFLRTARLPSYAAQPDDFRPLISEIRRTIAAVHNRWPSRTIESVTLCVDGEWRKALSRQIETELGLAVTTFDPWTACDLSSELERRPPKHGSRYAPLLGLLVDEAAGDRPALDFLNPRRAPAPPSRRRQYTIVGASVAAVALLFLAITWWSLSGIDSEIARLEAKSKSLDAALAQGQANEKLTADIDRWSVSDIVWLDELTSLANKLPSSQDTMLNGLRVGTTRSGGDIQLEGAVRAPAVLGALHDGLRDPTHRVEVQGGSQSDDNPKYRWRFKASVSVDRATPAAATPPPPKKN